MTQQEQQLLKLRQRVDRDSDLTKGARVLFGEIVNLHVLGDGCFKEYTTLADDLGMSPRTVRRRRKELSEAGYLKVKDSGGRRHLIPTAPDTDDCTEQQCPDTSDQPDSNDRTQVSAPDTDDNGAPDSSDDHRDNILPADAGESAPAREDPDGKPDWAPTLEQAKQRAEMKAPKIPPDTVEEWWLYREEHDWANCGEKWILNLKRWHMNDEKFDPGGGGDGATSRPGGTQFDPSKDQIRFGA